MNLEQRRRTFFKYEKRIRELSPPEKVRRWHAWLAALGRQAGPPPTSPTDWRVCSASTATIPSGF